jgi:hypothetical protein
VGLCGVVNNSLRRRMRTQPLPPWPKKKALREWLNSLREDVAAAQSMPSHNVLVNKTSQGTGYVGTAKGAERERAPGWFQGEYDSSRSYVEGDGVTISGGGTSSGCYIAIRDVPAGTAPSYPDVGIYWRIIGRTSDVSFFT